MRVHSELWLGPRKYFARLLGSHVMCDDVLGPLRRGEGWRSNRFATRHGRRQMAGAIISPWSRVVPVIKPCCPRHLVKVHLLSLPAEFNEDGTLGRFDYAVLG